jgi:hypothetical protein
VGNKQKRRAVTHTRKRMAKSKQRAPSASPRGKSVPSSPSEVPRNDDEEPGASSQTSSANASPVKQEQHDHDEEKAAHIEEKSVDSEVIVLEHACPLCIAKAITQPVVLHGYKDEKDGQHHVCLACEACARRWLDTALDDNQNTTLHRSVSAVTCPRCSHETDIEKSSDLMTLHEYEELVERQQSNRNGSKKGSMTNLVAGPVVLIDNLQTSIPQATPGEAVLCVMCDKEPAKAECTTCNCVLCQSCVEKTHKGSRLQSHVITAIGNIKRCERHPEMSKTIYCFECGEDICSRCFFAGHKLHQANDMLEVATESIEKCVEGMAALEALQSSSGSATAEGDANSFVEEIKSVKDDHERMQRQISDAFQSLRGALDARETQLRQTLSDFFDGKLDVLQGRSRLLRSTTDQIEAVRVALAEATPTIANVNTMMYTALFQPRIAALTAQLSKAVGGDGTGAAHSVRDIMEPIKEVRFVLTPTEHSKVLALLESTGTVELPKTRAAAKTPDVANNKRHTAVPAEVRSVAGTVVTAPTSSSHIAGSHWKASSLNISTQLPDVSNGRGSGGPQQIPSLPSNISKRRQHLTLTEEVEAGEPARKSTERVTNATTTLSGLSSHFLGKRPQPPMQPPAVAFGKKAPTGVPGAEEKGVPPAAPRSNMKFELKL